MGKHTLIPFNGPSILLTEDQTVSLNMIYQEEQPEELWLSEQDQIGNIVVKIARESQPAHRAYKINTIGEVKPHQEGVVTHG